MHYDNQTLETKNLCCSQKSRRLGCLIIVITLLTSSCGVVFFFLRALWVNSVSSAQNGDSGAAWGVTVLNQPSPSFSSPRVDSIGVNYRRVKPA